MRLAAMTCGLVGVLLAACGGDDSTTVIKEDAPPQTTTVTQEAASPEPVQQSAPAQTTTEEASTEAPDVVGLKLPAAKAELSAAGFTTRAKNTDTLLGIVVPANYTVCKQDPPAAGLVVVLAQKYGC